ncbi:MAG: acyltransferase family protein [Anaerolineales bacterium]|nr:acyltransferase family protein [Anaerolineales bacterium]
MRRIEQLTFTRFIAALSVVLFHTAKNVPPFDQHPFLREIFASGYIAVTYFFVLSGFVLSFAYSSTDKKLRLNEYFFSRFARIYPIYLLSFLLACLYYLDIMAKVDSRKIWANLFLVQSWIPSYAVSFNYVAWSLSVEVFLYAAFPFLLPPLSRLSTRNLIVVATLFWGASQWALTGTLARVADETYLYLVYFPPVYLSSFVIGIVAGVWYQRVNKESVRQRVNLGLLILGLALLIAALLLQPYLHLYTAFNTLEFGLLAPIYILIIITLALDTSFLSQTFSHPWLKTLGDASYALYITNIPLRWLAERTLGKYNIQVPAPIFAYVFIALAILLSILSYLKFETPSRIWLNANKQMLWLFALDIAALSLALWMAFVLRLGLGNLYQHNWRTFTFVVRMCVPATMIMLLAFRLYNPLTFRANFANLIWRSSLPHALSGLALIGLTYLAFQNGWIESFPRLILFLVIASTFATSILARIFFKKYILKFIPA